MKSLRIQNWQLVSLLVTALVFLIVIGNAVSSDQGAKVTATYLSQIEYPVAAHLFYSITETNSSKSVDTNYLVSLDTRAVFSGILFFLLVDLILVKLLAFRVRKTTLLQKSGKRFISLLTTTLVYLVASILLLLLLSCSSDMRVFIQLGVSDLDGPTGFIGGTYLLWLYIFYWSALLSLINGIVLYFATRSGRENWLLRTR